MRLFKTRALAGAQIGKGRVRLTRAGRTQRITKPHFGVREGDVITLVRGGEVWEGEVLALPARRGPASEAQGCYRASG